MKIIGIKNERTPSTVDFTVSVTKSGSVLTFNVVSIDTLVQDQTSDRYRIEDTYSVDLVDLRNRYDWVDYQVYFIAMENRKFIPLFALYPETLPTRETAVEYSSRLKRHLLIGINVPFYHSTDDDVFLTVNLSSSATDSNLVVSNNLEKVWSDASSSGVERLLRLPHIRTIAPATMAPDTTETVEIRIEDASGNLMEQNAIVYVEAISGFGGGTRVSIVNGIGMLPVMSSGMLSGSTLRMKLGWKYYVGVEDIIIQVI